jgi:hypothetical protein
MPLGAALSRNAYHDGPRVTIRDADPARLRRRRRHRHPALVVDLDAFERNLDLMANAVRGAAALRLHGSAQVPEIALA